MPYVSKRTAREVFEEYLSNGELAQGQLLTQRSQKLITEKFEQLEYGDEQVEVTERSIFTKSSLMPAGGDSKVNRVASKTARATARKGEKALAASNNKNLAYYTTPVAKIHIKKEQKDVSS